MGISVPAIGVLGGGRAKSAALLVLALVFSLGSRAHAADLSVTSGSTLNITGATSAVMPMTTQSSSVLPDASGGGAPDEGWLAGLHVSGFLSQTFGMWQNSQNLKQYTASRNSLAISRTWLQVDENYRLNEN